MKKLYPVLALVAFSAAGVQADWLLSTYETITTDSLSSATIYGYQPFFNAASKAVVTVPGDYVRFNATKIASDLPTAPKGDGYSANVGLLHPLTSDWAEHDLTGLTGISFEYKLGTPITSPDGMKVSFGSSSYDVRNADSGQVQLYMETTPDASDWVSVAIDLPDFTYPTWFSATAKAMLKKVTLDSVLKRVKNLQFSPSAAYPAASTGSQNSSGGGAVTPKACTGCVGATPTSQIMDIKNVVLLGVEKHPMPNPTNIGCSGAKSVLFDDFIDGDSKALSVSGAYWYTFSDSGKVDTTKANGSSVVDSVIVESDDGVTPGYMLMKAKLNKTIGSEWQAYAGWADIGVDFRAKGAVDLTGLTGISFDLGTMGGTISSNVETIAFKVSQLGLKDDAAFSAEIPSDKIPASGVVSVCIQPSDLKQGSYLTTKTALDLKKIVKMAWDAKITNSSDKTINTADVSLALTNVKFWGVADPLTVDVTGVLAHKNAIRFSASYNSGILSLEGFQAATGFEVLSLNGSKVASFAPAATVALDLPRGTYLVVAKNGALSTAHKLAVVGR